MALDWRKARDSKLLEKGKLLHQETKDRWKALKKKKRPHVAQTPKVKPNLKPRFTKKTCVRCLVNKVKKSNVSPRLCKECLMIEGIKMRDSKT